MTAHSETPADPAATTLVIVGASGDLAGRLLLPALGQLLATQPSRRVHLVGAGRTAMSATKWRARIRTAFDSAGAADAVGDLLSTPYIAADSSTTAGLREILREVPEGRLVLYFAVPPAVAASACASLTPSELPEGTVIALEKPFGSDEATARELNDVLRALIPEDRVFRVDHFLGRSSVLNLLGFRFANRFVEPVWSTEHIESVLIRFDESLALEGRADYYDRAGALIDMIQSHLLQVLAVIAMDQPATLGEDDVRSATAAVLRATRIWDDNPVHSSHRARYTAGSAGGVDVPAYVDERGVDPARETETLAQITCDIRTSRWVGVPFTLRSGKALGEPVAEIVIRFRPVRHLPTGFGGTAEGSVLRLSLGPDRLALEINVNGGDDPFGLHRATLDADLGLGALRSYTEVLAAVLDGDAALSVRGDAAEQCWRIIQPVRDAWRRGDVPLEVYPAGSEGPAGWLPAD